MHVCVKMMLKGSKEALTVLIVTHVTQVERVESGVLQLLHNTAYRVLNLLLMSKRAESVKSALLTLLDLSNYKGDCMQDAQPIPNS